MLRGREMLLKRRRLGSASLVTISGPTNVPPTPTPPRSGCFEDLVVDEERHFDQYEVQEENLEKFGEQFLALQSIERSKSLAGPAEGAA